MSLYLLPPVFNDSEIQALTKRAGVAFANFASVRDIILADNGAPYVIGSVSAQDLLVLTRHASTLMSEVPSVVVAAPGFSYTGDWVSLASALPSLDWTELVQKLSRSGHTAVKKESFDKKPEHQSYEVLLKSARDLETQPPVGGLVRRGPQKQEEEDTDPDFTADAAAS